MMYLSKGIQMASQVPSLLLTNATYANPSSDQQSFYYNNANNIQIVGSPYPVVYNFVPQIGIQPAITNTGSLNQVQGNQGTFFMHSPLLPGQQVITGFNNNQIQTTQQPLLQTNTGQSEALTNGPACQVQVNSVPVLPQTSAGSVAPTCDSIIEVIVNDKTETKTLSENKPNNEMQQPLASCEKSVNNIQQQKKFKKAMPSQKLRPFTTFKLVLDNDAEPAVSSFSCRATPVVENEEEDGLPGVSCQEKEDEGNGKKENEGNGKKENEGNGTKSGDSGDLKEQSGEAHSLYENDSNGSENLECLTENNVNDSDNKEHLKDNEKFRVKFKEKILLQNGQNGKRKKCNLCGNYVVKLDLHYEKYHGTPSKCEFCGEMFADVWETKKHLQKEHSENMSKELNCNICHKMFSQKVDLRRHKLATHRNKRKFTCEECGRNFNHLSTLENHQKVHSGDRSYVCEICGKRFPSRNKMRHARMHSQTKEFKCPECSRSFNEKDQLQKHLRLHTGERPYKCKHCLKAFNHNVSLKAHVKKYHADVECMSESGSVDVIVIG